MGKGKLGRYCEQAKRWLIPEVWKKWWRKKKKRKKMADGGVVDMTMMMEV